jgi:FkbM family methyltransferase
MRSGKIKKLFRKIIPGSLWFHVFDFKKSITAGYAVQSYSQEGEDILLLRLLNEKKDGFYVDVGAHHPKRYSNTYLLYKRGWHGINIDPNPHAIKLFKKHRTRDKNLEIGISDQVEKIRYYIFDDPALNTFDEKLATDRESQSKYRVIDSRDIEVKRLDDILSDNLPARKHIDVLNIDVEGFELKVLKSNNWKLYRPTYILIESLNSSIPALGNNSVHKFMDSHDYELLAKTLNTLIYKDRISAMYTG